MSNQILIKTIANIISNNLITQSTKTNKPISDLISSDNVIELAKLFIDNKINNQGLTKAIDVLIEFPNQSLVSILDENKLLQLTDMSALESVVDGVINSNPEQVEQYQSGKINVVGYLVGQCMKAAGGSGNPKLFNELLTNKLKLKI